LVLPHSPYCQFRLELPVFTGQNVYIARTSCFGTSPGFGQEGTNVTEYIPWAEAGWGIPRKIPATNTSAHNATAIFLAEAIDTMQRHAIGITIYIPIL
jgi:hypothetical protein